MIQLLNAIASVFQRRSTRVLPVPVAVRNRIYVLVKYNSPSEKLYFQFRKDGEDCYSVNRAGAWYFDSPDKARDARDFLGLKNELNIESFERI